MTWWLADLGLKGKTNAEQLSDNVLNFLASTGRVHEVVLDTGAVLWSPRFGRTGQPTEGGVLRVYILSAENPVSEDGAICAQSVPLPIALVYLKYDPATTYPPGDWMRFERKPEKEADIEIREADTGDTFSFEL